MFDRIGKDKYFTKVELQKGYYQVRIAEGNEPKIVCVMRYEAYEWLVMPFDLTNTPLTFCTSMNMLCHPYLDQIMVVYLDKIVMCTNTLEDHVKHLRKVIQVLQKNQLYIKREKCELTQHEVHFLGHIISQGKVHMDEAKVWAIQEWKAPTNVTELRSFLRRVNYYPRFISGYFAKVASSIESLKKNKY